MKTVIAIAQASLRGYVRDRAAVGWTLLFPAGLLALFAVLFSAGQPSFNVGWVDPAATAESAAVRTALAASGVAKLVDQGSEAGARDELRSGHIVAALIPTLRADGLHVEVLVGSVSSPAAATLTALVGQAIGDTIAQRVALIGIGETSSPARSLVPAILAMGLMQLGIYGAVTLVQQRERHVLKRLATAPISRRAVIGGFVSARLVVAVLQALVLLIAARVVFGVEIANVLALALAILAVAATFIAIGFALAGVARSEEAATQLASLVSVPLMLLSGLFVPLDQLPEVMRPIASLMPVSYAADALRQTMGGTAANGLEVSLLALSVWFGLSLVAAVRLFRWQ